ncbi:MAG: hypothetical protein AAF378_02365 [Cyanobacteria bacterium P01_A01_bin.84]
MWVEVPVLKGKRWYITAAIAYKQVWSFQLLVSSLMWCLKENPVSVGEEIQTATFGDGKYRVRIKRTNYL